MSKRKPRQEEEPAFGKGGEEAPKPEVIVPDPPQPNSVFLATSAVLYLAWLGFLIWMATTR